MKLSELAQTLTGARIVGDGETDVRAICDDSRKASAGCLFVAVRGNGVDGHHFIPHASDRGAAAYLVENEAVLPEGSAGLVVSNSRVALAAVAHRFYGDSSRDLALVGVTGTNGKTTTVYLTDAILAAAGKRPGMIGTVQVRIGDRARPAGNTTPGSLELATTLAEMRAAGCLSAVFEVSSHALDQRRADGCHLDVACFTNLTRDHLDYHGHVEAYFEAKRRLFVDVLAGSAKPKRTAVVNIDDRYGARLADELPGRGISVIAFSAAGAAAADVAVIGSDVTIDGTRVTLRTPAGEIAVESKLVGAFNRDNIAAAAACAVALGIAPETIAAGIAGLSGVPGRLERIEGGEITVLVDYAHTGDALFRSVATVRGLAPRRLITVFGCGGDRDRGKRPIMGRAAAEKSDLAIVTSDNPRTEDPDAIISEILPGLAEAGAMHVSAKDAAGRLSGRNYVVVPDRRAAIRLAVSIAEPGDVVLIAGKGHEDYQILGTRKIHFDDREEARSALARRASRA